jgi:hypothetical protein
MAPDSDFREDDPPVAAFFARLLERSAALRMPELFRSPPPGALFHLPDRHGVGVVALRTTDLTREQLVGIMTYRLAQYVVLDYVNKRMVYEAGLEQGARGRVAPRLLRPGRAPRVRARPERHHRPGPLRAAAAPLLSRLRRP